jgi:hypothetical protein
MVGLYLRTITQLALALLACAVFPSLTFAQGLPLEPTILSDQKPGSALFFHRYRSSLSGTPATDTQINITNTNQSLSTDVHLFFVNGLDCSVEDRTIRLTPSQTVTLFARVEDPGVEGYLVAVATDPLSGRPTQFNFLIGDASIREVIQSRQFQVNLTAVAVAKRAAGATTLNGDGFSSNLIFNGGAGVNSYDRLPQVVAASSFLSQVANRTVLVIYTPSADLTAATPPTTNMMIQFFDDMENVMATTFSLTCYVRPTLGSLLGTINTLVPAGRTGWMRITPTTAGRPLLGATLNAGSSFNGGHNLHHLTLLNTYTMRVPVF